MDKRVEAAVQALRQKYSRVDGPDRLRDDVVLALAAADAAASQAVQAVGAVPERLVAAFKRGGFRVPETMDEAIAQAANVIIEDRIAIEHLEKKLAAPPAQAQQAPTDERAAFEAWCHDMGIDPKFDDLEWHERAFTAGCRAALASFGGGGGV